MKVDAATRAIPALLTTPRTLAMDCDNYFSVNDIRHCRVKSHAKKVRKLTVKGKITFVILFS